MPSCWKQVIVKQSYSLRSCVWVAEVCVKAAGIAKLVHAHNYTHYGSKSSIDRQAPKTFRLISNFIYITPCRLLAATLRFLSHPWCQVLCPGSLDQSLCLTWNSWGIPWNPNRIFKQLLRNYLAVTTLVVEHTCSRQSCNKQFRIIEVYDRTLQFMDDWGQWIAASTKNHPVPNSRIASWDRFSS
jgi:hypothetical protein